MEGISASRFVRVKLSAGSDWMLLSNVRLGRNPLTPRILRSHRGHAGPTLTLEFAWFFYLFFFLVFMAAHQWLHSHAQVRRNVFYRQLMPVCWWSTVNCRFAAQPNRKLNGNLTTLIGFFAAGMKADSRQTCSHWLLLMPQMDTRAYPSWYSCTFTLQSSLTSRPALY